MKRSLLSASGANRRRPASSPAAAHRLACARRAPRASATPPGGREPASEAFRSAARRGAWAAGRLLRSSRRSGAAAQRRSRPATWRAARPLCRVSARAPSEASCATDAPSGPASHARAGRHRRVSRRAIRSSPRSRDADAAGDRGVADAAPKTDARRRVAGVAVREAASSRRS